MKIEKNVCNLSDRLKLNILNMQRVFENIKENPKQKWSKEMDRKYTRD